MKALISLVFAFFALNTAYAGKPAAGNQLKSTVESLGMCVGLAGLDGYVVYFSPNGIATIGALTEESREQIGAYAVEYGYATAYNKFMEIGEVASYVTSSWEVKGQQVLVKLDPTSSRQESLVIAFKSKYCTSYQEGM